MSNVLLIEDDTILVDDLKFFVEEKGHSCVVYRYADDVVMNLPNFGVYDTIVLDIMMMKGKYIKDENPAIETGEILYKMIRVPYPKKRIIIISAKEFENMKTDFKEDENVRLFRKPFDEKKLKQLLDEIV
jgi:CheY-like chemotaxis protein